MVTVLLGFAGSVFLLIMLSPNGYGVVFLALFLVLFLQIFSVQEIVVVVFLMLFSVNILQSFSSTPSIIFWKKMRLGAQAALNLSPSAAMTIVAPLIAFFGTVFRVQE